MTMTAYPLMIGWTLLGILLFPLLFAGWYYFTGWPTAKIVRHFIWLYGRGWLLLMRPFVRFRFDGKDVEGRNWQEPAIFVVNHCSFFDTYCMGLLPVFDIAFAVRSWPFKMWWYRRFMLLARYLNVEDDSWEDISAKGRKVLDAGGNLLFFPEGHRSRDGKLQRFYNGAFRMAVESGRPVVPLCLTGTGELLPPERWWMQPTHITMRVLAPVDPAGFEGDDTVRSLRIEVKKRMSEALAEGDR